MCQLVSVLIHLAVYHANNGADNPGQTEGAPAHVQVVGKPMMDEELIEIMKVVEEVLKASS